MRCLEWIRRWLVWFLAIKWLHLVSSIAGCYHFFQNRVFFSLAGEVFLIKRTKKVFFLKNLKITSNIMSLNISFLDFICDAFPYNHECNWVKRNCRRY
jgi:hypothetical protein